MGKVILTAAILLAFSALANADVKSGTCANGQQGVQSTSAHSALIAGKIINYSATVGFVEVESKDKTSKACIFFTAYTVPSEKPRPLTFAFNGGPGSSSVWLHLGFLGPKRIDMGEDGKQMPPLDSALIPNEFSPLDVSDIVLIDPVATGFSFPQGDTADKFFGAKNDYASVASFIRNYLNVNNRWLSPKFIVGESYGGIRGALLARYLQSDMLIGLDGVFFVSPAFSFTPLDFSVPDNLASYWSFFPSFAATAWYHKVIAEKYRSMDLASVYAAAKKFADTTYRDALIRGNTLSDDQMDVVAQSISDFTGLSKNRVLKMNLKITDLGYFQNLMGNKNQIVGRFDGRYLGPMNGDPEDRFGSDPSSVALQYSYTAGINQYLRGDLNFNYAGAYNIIVDITKWPFDSDGAYFNVINDLAHALTDNPKLKIAIASGYFDLACPMGSVEYDLAQMPMRKTFASRITLNRYFGGHMMYIHTESLKQLKTDFASFVREQSKSVATPLPVMMK